MVSEVYLVKLLVTVETIGYIIDSFIDLATFKALSDTGDFHLRKKYKYWQFTKFANAFERPIERFTF